jgi:modification methylase
MKTSHTIHFEPAQQMTSVMDESVDLVVTSPPYPMIEMWDELE